MKIRVAAAIAACLILPFGAAACSDDSTGDLDKGELTKELEEQTGLTTEEAECAADAMIAADFTREELDSLNANETDEVDADKVAKFTEAITECVDIPGLTED